MMNKVIKNSPNHYNGRCGYKADVIVFHQTGGDTLVPALNWYMNPGALCSPNWVIDKDGTIYELVNADNAAYCNGTQASNSNAKLYYANATSRIVKSRKTNANYYTYSMEFVHCAKGNITKAQIDACVELIKTIIIPHMKANGVVPRIDRDHCIGHCEIDPKGREFCPGKQFPYDEIIGKVNGVISSNVKPTHESISETFKVGDKVKIKSTAINYAGVNTLIPERYKNKPYTVSKSYSDGSKVLIKELYSWVFTKDLFKV